MEYDGRDQQHDHSIETKEAGNDDPDHAKEDDVEKTDHHREQLLFFNYHEISIEDYKSLSVSKDKPLIITHFPNPYPSKTSNTRIVRIPRDYSKSVDDIIPIFSNVLPGYEQAALIDNDELGTADGVKKFVIRGCYNDQWFGCSSVSPLSNYLNPTEFESIVNKVNDLIQDALQEFSISNILWTFIDSMFFTLPSMFRLRSLKIWDKGKFHILENYIDELNDTGGICYKRGIRLISPRSSGFLSLDFEIPTPTLEASQIAH